MLSGKMVHDIGHIRSWSLIPEFHFVSFQGTNWFPCVFTCLFRNTGFDEALLLWEIDSFCKANWCEGLRWWDGGPLNCARGDISGL